MNRLIITASVLALAGCGGSAARVRPPPSSPPPVAAVTVPTLPGTAACAQFTVTISKIHRELNATHGLLGEQVGAVEKHGLQWSARFTMEASETSSPGLRVTLTRAAHYARQARATALNHLLPGNKDIHGLGREIKRAGVYCGA